MLNTYPLHAFIPTLNPGRAKEFYGETLGLPQVSESPFALEFNANGTPAACNYRAGLNTASVYRFRLGV